MGPLEGSGAGLETAAAGSALLCGSSSPSVTACGCRLLPAALAPALRLVSLLVDAREFGASADVTC